MEIKINTSFLVKLILIFALVNLACSASSQILDLTDQSFEEHRLKHDYVLIYFHASYSEESKHLQGQFRKLANYLATSKDLIYAVITQKNYVVNHKYNIEFPYPRIILVNKDTFWEYKGEMKTGEIGDWVQRKLNRELQVINTSEELMAGLDKFDRMILLVSEKDKIEQFTKSSNLTDTFTDLHFFLMNNLTLIQSLKIEEKEKTLDEKVIIVKTYDDLINVYKGKISDAVKLEKFIRAYAYPLLNHFSPNNYLYAVNSRLSFTTLLLPGNATEEESHSLVSEFYQNAKKFPGELFFMYGNLTDQQQTTLAIDFEVEEKDLPVILIQQYPKEDRLIKRFKLTEVKLEDSSENSNAITEFFNKYKYAALRRFLKSERPSANPYVAGENVNYLARKNFEEFLSKDEDKYALVFFVRKNCGPCNEYKKEFMYVAEYHRDKYIDFAIVDGVANEFDEFEIPGFPSLILFGRGKNKIKHTFVFDSLFTYHNIVKFLRTHMGTLYHKKTEL